MAVVSVLRQSNVLDRSKGLWLRSEQGEKPLMPGQDVFLDNFASILDWHIVLIAPKFQDNYIRTKRT